VPCEMTLRVAQQPAVAMVKKALGAFGPGGKDCGSGRSNLANGEQPPARFEHSVNIQLLVRYRTALSDLLNQALILCPLLV
jgi:hypothetical protein